MAESKNIKIYAPVDCHVEDIKELNDGVFSEGLLGMGIFFEPKNNKICSPVYGKCVQIFHTKHAIHFEDSNGNILLMHIGIDSVQLNGEGFDLKIQPGQTVEPKTEVVDVDFKLFEKNNIIKSTPIVIEQDQKYDYKIIFLKPGDYKKGDLILEIEKTIKTETNIEKEEINLLDEQGNTLPIIFQDKWESLSAEVLKAVQSKDNVVNINNCNTRLRLQIKDTSIINTEEVKNNRWVKGVNLKGNELQIIIGPDAYKLKDAFTEFINKKQVSLKTKAPAESFKSKFIKIVNGVLVPVVPVICAASFITLVKTILETTGVIDSVSLNYIFSNNESLINGGIKILSDYGLVTGLFFILSQTAWAFVGIYFSYSTVKFLKGNEIMGILIGLTLICPFLFGGAKWDLFSLGNWTFSVTAYPSSILPHIFVGVVYVYFDRWVRKWMPVSVDLIFRHSLTYAVSLLSVFLFAGPLLALVESGLYFVIIDGLANIPYGIGTGIFGLLWQPLVLTGMHAAFYIPINQQIGEGTPLVLGTVKEIGSLGQFGACFALLFITKNSNLKQVAVSAAPPALLGITEPAIYGCNLVKVTPFIAGCIGSGIGGIYYGVTNTQLYAIGNGVLCAIGAIPGGTMNLVNCLIGFVITICSAFVITLFLYKERVDEQKGIKKIYKKISSLINPKNEAIISFDTEISEISELYSKETKEQIKRLEDLLYKKGIIENKLEKINVKEDLKKQNYSKKALKAYKKDNNEKVVKYNTLLQNVKSNKKSLNDKLEEYIREILELNSQYNKITIKAKEITNESVDRVVMITNKSEFNEIKNNFNQLIMALENNALNLPKNNEELFNFHAFAKKQKNSSKVNA
ncbi:beta-glucoside PTS system IIABC component [Mesoplasma florum L1]|uniref:Beta-glucoside PTS system IIABC component n=1 Tax=Mesoplasma florum (strain ATCC 33453 / NBRC 100688 / NCTC 11704 / L1) TaxID=265311 RepID=Q6F1E8_MESFL|nr:glucose PTS transporter subunit IIA [Mesoplasma florum]AAT75675.1 beta-glucoside PTS system IIABC component [Mesoplasma florum L1]ATI73958.1 hypothetical protein CQZ70_01680 [Mesoplasma florum]